MQPPYSATISLGLVLSTLLGAIAPATAQINPELPAFEPRTEPTEEGTRGTGSGTTSRDGGVCLDPGDRITPLVPEGSPLTTNTLPGFVAILPPAKSGVGTPVGRLEIFEIPMGGGNLYEATFPLPDTPGMVKISPATLAEAGLEPGKTYGWAIMMVCDVGFVEGVGEFRIAEPTPEVSDRLGEATCSDEPALCASDGIWYDPLVALFEAKLADPDSAEIDAAWRSLLESAGLGEYADVPLAGSLVPNERTISGN